MVEFFDALYEDLRDFVRMGAWLHAVLEKQPNDKSGAARITRLDQMRQQMKDDEYSPTLPEVQGGEHLLGYLYEVGPIMAGARPLTHQEIAFWQLNIGVQLEPWEVRFIFRLSREHAAQLHLSEKRDCPAPWKSDQADVTTLKRSTADGLRKYLSGMARP